MNTFAGFLLDKKIGVNQPKRIENAKILIANSSMDTDKIKVRENSFISSGLVKQYFWQAAQYLNLQNLFYQIVS